MRVVVTGKMIEAVVKRPCREHTVVMHTEDWKVERRTLLRAVEGAHGLLSMFTDKVDDELLAAGPRLKIVSNFGVGVDNIDIASATRRKIMVTNTPDVLTDATADLAFALILAAGRRVVEGDNRTRGRMFKFPALFEFLGHDISEKTLGIVGLGRIGKAVAKRAAGFSMKVLYYNRTRLSPAEEAQAGVSFVDLHTLFQEADFVSLHVPLTAETRHLVNADMLRQMKPTAVLVNTARGPVVDEAALVSALRAGRILAAGLDVYEHEPDLAPGLSDLDNVILLPHVGSATLETRTRMAHLAADNLLAGLQGVLPPNCLNPEVFSG
ncbi:D-glycerate dehydrogenase [Desulfosarcina sp. OttesenSCG-928-G10]|nr:D-glycerate dehydrogenase [Desulfosarcina sp. OttesenSCG-928-G10]